METQFLFRKIESLFPLILAAMLACGLASHADAQGLGTIVGTVTDPSGGVLPSVIVTATMAATGASRSTASNAQGYFVIPSLQPARYDLRFEAPGFAGLMRQVFGSWQLSGIFTFQSGGPLTILAGKDQSQTGLGTDRAQLLSNTTKGPGACNGLAPCVDFLNAGAFGLPPVGAFGNVGKGSLTGPNLINWDMGLFKNFPLRGDRYRFQFHADFFNIFNRVNLSNPNQTVSSSGFGSIRGAADPRIGQLALKLFF